MVNALPAANATEPRTALDNAARRGRSVIVDISVLLSMSWTWLAVEVGVRVVRSPPAPGAGEVRQEGGWRPRHTS